MVIDKIVNYERKESQDGFLSTESLFSIDFSIILWRLRVSRVFRLGWSTGSSIRRAGRGSNFLAFRLVPFQTVFVV